MKKTETNHKQAALIFAALLCLLLWPLGASSQTVRGDFDYDGDFDITDATLLINYLLNDKWNDIPAVERDTVIVKGIPFVMVHVEGGTYERFGGLVTVGDFWIGQTEVTQQLWRSVTGSNPSMYAGVYYVQHPVERVTWNQCQAFIDSLNALTGLSFRLPTDLEWDFAARGGNHSSGTLYAGSNNPMLVAWYDEISGNCHHAVAQLKCNELGLYDMSGNVNEWCQDPYPLGVSGNSTARIYRGGSYSAPVGQSAIGYSNGYNINQSTGNIGLRLAM